MAQTKTAYRNYLFETVNDRERLALVHSLNKPNFVQKLQQVLTDYELTPQIKAALAGSRPKVKILDVGCGEGLYLHDVAHELETQGLLEGVILYGFDIDTTAIETAIQFSQVSKPPRPYLNFYWQDLTQPLDKNLFGELQFDFIYAYLTLPFLPNARQNLAKLYEMLAPGGTIFLRDLVLHEGEDGWQINETAQPLRPFCQAIYGMVSRVNAEQDVSLEYSAWLRELGASLLQTIPDIVASGGEAKSGMDALRVMIMTLRNMKPVLVSSKTMTETQIEDLMAILYREINPNWQGITRYMNTLARKPFSNI